MEEPAAQFPPNHLLALRLNLCPPIADKDAGKLGKHLVVLMNSGKSKKALLLCWITAMCFACSPQAPPVQKTERPGASELTGSLSPELAKKQETTSKRGRFERSGKVSAFELNDSKFLVHRVTIGLQTFMNSESPVLKFDLPADTDFVQIKRCPTDASIAGEVDTIKLEDIELSDMSASEKDRLYRNNNFFLHADDAACTEVSTGTIKTTFFDSWAPTGNYRYLVRACVGQERLSGTENLITDQCSRQIAVSSPLKDYVNKRKDAENKYLAEANKISSEVDALFRSLQRSATEYSEAFKDYGEDEFQKAVGKEKKDAIVHAIAVTADISLEIYTWVGQGWGWKSVAMNIFQLSQAMGGFTFDAMFMQLGARSEDIPRACARCIRLDKETAAVTNSLSDAIVRYHNAVLRARLAAAGQEAAAGEGVSPGLQQQGAPEGPQMPPLNTPPGEEGSDE
ncbi:MAG: hypothetical protein HYW48_09535 [Deltaproteobacteria bacterium]|nr:hypothetical protein [Deltaproteobacteria bacterium]